MTPDPKPTPAEVEAALAAKGYLRTPEEAAASADPLAPIIARAEQIANATSHTLSHDAAVKAILAAEVLELRRENERLNGKWTNYEQNYILPVFDWATAMGWDLRAMVRDNPGKNCVVLFFERLRAERDELRAALKPFAAVPIHPMAGDEMQAALSVAGRHHDLLTARQFRRARDLLDPPAPANNAALTDIRKAPLKPGQEEPT